MNDSQPHPPPTKKSKLLTSLYTQENLDTLLHNTDEIYILVDKSLTVIAANYTAKKRIWNRLKVQVKKNMSVLELVDPALKEQVTAIYYKVFEGETVDVIYPVPAANKQTSYFKVIYKPAVDDSGTIIGALVTVADITPAKQAEEILLKSEERWRFALEGSNQGMWDWNVKTGETFYSLSWKKLFGFEEHEIRNDIKEWQTRVHPDDREMIKEKLQSHLASVDPYYESIYRFKAKNGSYRWILARGMLLQRAIDGSPVRMIGTHTDITERKQLEENYKRLFNANPLPMWTYDLHTFRFLEVNEAAIRLYGYSRQEFLHLSVHQIEADRHKKNAAKPKSSPATPNYRQHIKKDGSYITVNITNQVLEEGERKIALVLSEDVTEKVEAEQKLQQSEEQYKSLFQCNPLPTWIYDVKTLQILAVNNAAMEHYGYTHAEFMNMTLPDIHPQEQLALLYKRLEKEKVEPTLVESKWKHRKRSGDIIYVDIKTIAINYHQVNARLVVVHDVTGMVLAERNLLVSNKRFELATKAASEALWEWDIENDSVYISPAYKDMFGFDIDPNRKYEEWHDYIHPEDRQRIFKSFYGTIDDAAKDHWQDEYRYLKADGSYLYVTDSCIIIRNEHGKALKVVGAMQDISHRKAAENEILISNERFALASKATSDIIYDWDLVQKTLTWSESLFTIFGYESSQFTLDNWETHVHEEDRKEVVKSLYKTINNSNKRLWIKQYRLRKSDGTYRYVIEKGFIVRDSEGVAIRMIGALQDITDLKQKELALTQSNERFDAVIKATNDLIWDWDLQTRTFYRDKQGVANVYGVRDESTIKTFENWMQRIHADDADLVQSTITNVIENNTLDTFELEYRFKRDDGNLAFILDRGIILKNENGKPVRLIGAAQDITLRKKLEQTLLQKELEKQKIISKATIDTQEQERSEIGKELHDNVNQVLTTTKLYLELSQSTPALKDDLIQKSINNVVYVINEIRQLSRSLMDPSIGDLGLMDSIKDLIESINTTQKLQVILKGSKEIDGLLSENLKLMVFRILQEALNNAINHAQATNVLISIKKKDKTIALTVQDNGIGFVPEKTKKGAGLKNIQNRVYLANGAFAVDSAPGKGCKIMINFPYT